MKSRLTRKDSDAEQDGRQELGLSITGAYIVNLDSILKSRDIALPTKVRLVKAMVFPVVIYGCESWTVDRKAHV